MPEETTVAESVSAPDVTIDAPEVKIDSGSDWKSSLSDDIRNDPSIADINSVEDLAKKTIHSQKMIGNNTYIPSDNDDADRWNEFYGKIGRPKEAADYQLKSKLKDGQETAIVPDEMLSGYSKAAHEFGLTTKQANGMLGYYEGLSVKADVDSDQFLAKVKQDAIDELQKEYGDSYDQKIEMARTVMREVGSTKLMEDAESTGFSMNPDYVRLLVKVGAMIGEDRVLGQNKRDIKLDPQTAKMQLDSLRRDPENMKARQDPSHPKHQEVTDMFTKLHSEMTSNPS